MAKRVRASASSGDNHKISFSLAYQMSDLQARISMVLTCRLFHSFSLTVTPPCQHVVRYWQELFLFKLDLVNVVQERLVAMDGIYSREWTFYPMDKTVRALGQALGLALDAWVRNSRYLIMSKFYQIARNLKVLHVAPSTLNIPFGVFAALEEVHLMDWASSTARALHGSDQLLWPLGDLDQAVKLKTILVSSYKVEVLDEAVLARWLKLRHLSTVDLHGFQTRHALETVTVPEESCLHTLAIMSGAQVSTRKWDKAEGEGETLVEQRVPGQRFSLDESWDPAFLAKVLVRFSKLENLYLASELLAPGHVEEAQRVTRNAKVQFWNVRARG